MKIKYLCTIWGMHKPTIEENLSLIRNAGFEGVEMKVPVDKTERNILKSLLKEMELDLVSQVRAEGATVKDQIESFQIELNRVVEFNPLLVNVHSGKDFWALKNNLEVITNIEKISNNYGIKIVHETHRARATFCTTATMELIKTLPTIRFTADFSHWCCVHNSLLQDQCDSVNNLIKRSDYIHARVGSAVTPQVTDPRAPEWKNCVEVHIKWWKDIVDFHKNSNSEVLPICSEFGPPEYMATIPFIQKPVANLWEINCYMKDMLKDRFGDN